MRIALAAGLILMTVALAVTLAKAPLSVARKNFTFEQNLGSSEEELAACQSGELLPRGTTAIRLTIVAYTGPRLEIAAFTQRRVVTYGDLGSGWTGGAVTVPLAIVPRTSTRVRLCYGWVLHHSETVTLYGERTSPARAARRRNGLPLAGRIRVEYMRPGKSSWLSLAPSVARRMGLGRAAAGTWIVVLATALTLVVALLSSRLVLRELR